MPGRGHVLHRPAVATANVRGAGGRFGCVPAAHEAASLGLLDMADHAVTVTDHRWKHGASFLLFFRSFFFPIFEGAQAYKHLSRLALYTEPCKTPTVKKGKCVIPEICSFHVCMYICSKVEGMPLNI